MSKSKPCPNCGGTIADGRASMCVPCRNAGWSTPVPDDFREHAGSISNSEAMERWRCKKDVLTRWRKETGIRAPLRNGGMNRKPMPPSFRLMAPRMTMKQARAHYGCSQAKIAEWAKEAGIQLRRAASHVPPGPRQTIQKPTNRDMSLAGRAVSECLQRVGPVLRCDALGHPLEDGFFWNRGGHVLTDDDVIARAKRLGWEPDAWMKVAA